jgi:galactonate dehydratase
MTKKSASASTSYSRRDFLTRAAALTAAGVAAGVPATRVLADEKVDAAKALNLKITGLKTFVVNTGATSDENYVFVKLYTNKGIVGLGEGTFTGRGRTVATAIEEFERYLVGRDPTDIEYLWQAMFRGLRYRGGPVLMSAIAAIDVALWDILGQALGVPIWKLLGGKARDKVEVYVKRTKQPIDPKLSPEEKQVAKWAGIKKDGWRGSKGQFLFSQAGGVMDPAKGIREGIEFLRKVREAVGPDFNILCELHGQATLPMALRFCREAEPYNPFLVEEPTQLEDFDELAQLRAHTSVPLATGERMCTKFLFAELCSRHLVDYVQPDIVHCGGLTEVKKIGALAESFRAQLLPHNPNSRVCTWASLHICMSTPSATLLETSSSEYEQWDELFFGRATVYQDGFALPPDRPGLGLELNEKEAAKYPYQPKPWTSLQWPDGAIHDR